MSIATEARGPGSDSISISSLDERGEGATGAPIGAGFPTSRGPEWLLAAFTGLAFLFGLNGMELWGKREQRAAAETLDTLTRSHWLVAEIQGRPRLEKPPLPRWITAGLMTATGRSDEALVRLPNALAGCGLVGLAYWFGRSAGGRATGLLAGYALSTTIFLMIEMRQAGNDGLLALFTTGALYAAWRRLHGGSGSEGARAFEAGVGGGAFEAGDGRWGLAMYGALGLAFLCKGPIALLLAGLVLVPYLAIRGWLRAGSRALWDPRGLALFAALGASWPALVVMNDPNAAKVWWLEMAMKAGNTALTEHRREILATQWPLMTAPWIVIATAAAALPWRRAWWASGGSGDGGGAAARIGRVDPRVWFFWLWTFATLGMFCFWTVAKSNYYLPCMAGMAVMTGLEWERLLRSARSRPGETGERRLARWVFAGHWIAFGGIALGAPAAVWRWYPELLVPVSLASVFLGLGAALAARGFARGRDATTMAGLGAAMTAIAMIGFGWIAPKYNGQKGFSELAGTLERILPSDARTVMFFDEIDEGLWFYLRDRTLAPVPGSEPKYNHAFDFEREIRAEGVTDPAEARKRLGARRFEENRRLLLTWLGSEDRESDFVLIRSKLLDRFLANGDFAGELGELAEFAHRESDLARSELTLLKARRPRRVDAAE